MSVNPQLLKILRCPACLSKLKLVGTTLTCLNAECRRQYQIKNDIPNMLIDESTVLNETDWKTQTEN